MCSSQREMAVTFFTDVYLTRVGVFSKPVDTQIVSAGMHQRRGSSSTSNLRWVSVNSGRLAPQINLLGVEYGRVAKRQKPGPGCKDRLMPSFAGRR